MDEMTSNPRQDDLIDRLLDGDATDAEWNEFDGLAQRDATLWREFALAHRDCSALRLAVTDAAVIAESVSIPSHHVAGARGSASHYKLRSLNAWAGWAVAAMLAVVASGQLNFFNRSASNTTPIPIQKAGLDFSSTNDAFDAYVKKGREMGDVVGVVPTRMLVETRPAASGEGVEIIYIRQVIERAVVPDLYQVQGFDDLGQPNLIRCPQSPRSSM